MTQPRTSLGALLLAIILVTAPSCGRGLDAQLCDPFARGNTDAVEQAQKLIDQGANVNRQFLTEDNTTCLMGVSAVGAVEAVEFLLQAGADPNLETFQGHTALRFAVNGGHVEVVRLLIESGADVNHKAADGEAPLVIAQRLKNDQVTEVLRAAGAQE